MESSGSSGRRRPTVVDLFCGAGGLALGFEQAGFDVLAAADYDPVHAAVHAFNFPLARTLCADVSTLSGDEVTAAASEGWGLHHPDVPWSGEIDAVVGGPPCQGFSTIGRRLIDDHRNQLVFHFFRLIDELQPRYFVMENVPGMAAGGHSSILNQLVEEFEGAGYETAKPVRTLNASSYGVPQARTRLFLLGWRSGERPVGYPEATVRPVPKRPSENGTLKGNGSMPVGPTAWEAVGDLPDLDGFEELLATDQVELSAAQLRAMERAASPYARRLRGMEEDPGDLSHPRNWDRRLLTSSNRTRHTPKSVDRFEGTVPGETEPVSRFYRIHPDGLCNTLRAGTGSERGAYTSPRPIHPTLPRVISVREAARLHSFPDWFRFHRTKWHGFRQIGNSVPPLLGRAVARQLVEAMRTSPVRPGRLVRLGDEKLLSYAMSDAADHFDAHPSEIPQPRQRSAAG